jgi:hypothetical protein
MTRRRIQWAAMWVLAVLAASAAARAETVDVELVLSVDSLGSIDDEEFDLQRLGYARALTDPRVLKAIRSGPHKAIAITLIEWSGPGITQQVVPWTRIANKEDAERVAALLLSAPRTIFSGGTSLGAAIDDGIAINGLPILEFGPYLRIISSDSWSAGAGLS